MGLSGTHFVASAAVNGLIWCFVFL